MSDAEYVTDAELLTAALDQAGVTLDALIKEAKTGRLSSDLNRRTWLIVSYLL